MIDDRPDPEAARQGALLAALFGAEAGEGLRAADWAVPVARGLSAYRVNAGAAAERALSSAFPVVRALVGEDSFAALARAYWRACPPVRGDLALLGEGLARFIDADPLLADVPYLGDVARLEAALARAEAAADAPGETAARLASLALLAQHDPDELRLALAPGATVLRSPWPVGTLWQAHGQAPGRPSMDEARQALQARRAQAVFVCRPSWAAELHPVDAPEAAFLESLVAGRSLGQAWRAAAGVQPDWSFEGWLGRAVPAGWTAGARLGPPPPD